MIVVFSLRGGLQNVCVEEILVEMVVGQFYVVVGRFDVYWLFLNFFKTKFILDDGR